MPTFSLGNKAAIRKEQLYFVINEIMKDEYDTEIRQQAQRLKRNICCSYASARRDYVPKLPNYMESVIREMGIPEKLTIFENIIVQPDTYLTFCWK